MTVVLCRRCGLCLQPCALLDFKSAYAAGEFVQRTGVSITYEGPRPGIDLEEITTRIEDLTKNEETSDLQVHALKLDND